MGDYASKGVAGTGLGLGIAGTALSLLNNGNGGVLGGLFGCNNNGTAVAAMQGNAYVAALAQKDSEIGQLKAEKYTDNKIAEAYIGLDSKITKVAADLATLSLNNERRIGVIEGQLSNLAQATNTALAQLNATVAGITKTVIPTTAICPEVMPRYNSWVAPTNTPAPTAA